MASGAESTDRDLQSLPARTGRQRRGRWPAPTGIYRAARSRRMAGGHELRSAPCRDPLAMPVRPRTACTQRVDGIGGLSSSSRWTSGSRPASTPLIGSDVSHSRSCPPSIRRHVFSRRDRLRRTGPSHGGRRSFRPHGVALSSTTHPTSGDAEIVAVSFAKLAARQRAANSRNPPTEPPAERPHDGSNTQRPGWSPNFATPEMVQAREVGRHRLTADWAQHRPVRLRNLPIVCDMQRVQGLSWRTNRWDPRLPVPSFARRGISVCGQKPGLGENRWFDYQRRKGPPESFGWSP